MFTLCLFDVYSDVILQSKNKPSWKSQRTNGTDRTIKVNRMVDRHRLDSNPWIFIIIIIIILSWKNLKYVLNFWILICSQYLMSLSQRQAKLSIKSKVNKKFYNLWPITPPRTTSCASAIFDFKRRVWFRNISYFVQF